MASLAVTLTVGVLVMVDRVGSPARFVTWPVVAFTAGAALVAVVGLTTGLSRPVLLTTGMLASLAVSYLLPAAPLPVVAVVVMCLGGLALTVGGFASGLAAGTGSLMVLLVVLQGPAVECGTSSVSANSGPWWVESPDTSAGSGSTSADGVSRGTVQVGDRRYEFTCDHGTLTGFHRAG